jgi:cardiolipin synthase
MGLQIADDVVPRRRRWRAVLRPRPGRRLPQELRPANAGKTATCLAGGVRDPGFEGLLSRIDDSPLHCGGSLELYFQGQRAVRAMLAAIGEARSEVLIESYVLKDDSTGQAFLAALGAAAERGVPVRVLADALGSLETSAAFWREMEGRGIELRLYHPLLPYLWMQAFRDHRKILVVDRKVAFTGGMNIGDEYGAARQEQPDVWRDTHARTEGPVAWELAVIFFEGWVHAGGEAVPIPPLNAERRPGPRTLVLDSRPGRGHRESASAFAALIGAARERLFITNSYFAPLRATIRELVRAARRGVDVRLLLPGLSDVALVRHAGHAMYAQLLDAGVRIWEYRPSVLHAKTAVADGFASVVGSSNLDVRSFRFNAECNLLVLDREIGECLESAFRDDLEVSDEIDLPAWRRRGLAHRLGDGLAGLLAPLL